MKRLNLWIISHPVLVMAGILGITVILISQIPKLVIDTSAEGLMVEKDPSKVYYEEVKRKFGSDNLTILLVKADDVFTTPVLGLVQWMTAELLNTPGVSRVESLTTVNNIKDDEGMLNTEPLIGDEIPSDPAEIERIRKDAHANLIFLGNVVSKDGRAAAINIYTETGPGDKEFNARFSGRVEEMIRQEAARNIPGVTDIYQIGGPITKVTFSQFIQADQINLVPISLVVLFVILYLSFRMLQGVLLPIVTGLLSVAWGLGMMAWANIPVNVVTAIIPSILISIGFTEDTHMISKYHQNLQKGLSKLDAIRDMAFHSAIPILVATSTTALGFASLITCDITMLIQFGYASSMALLGSFLVTICVVPTFLQLMPVPKRIRKLSLEDESSEGFVPRLMTGIGTFVCGHKRGIVIAALILVGVSLAGLSRLKVNSDFISYFPENSFIRQRTKDLHHQMSGALNFYIVVETGKAGGAREPAALGHVEGLQKFLDGTGKIDKTVSLADYLKKLNREMNNGDPNFDHVPPTADLVEQYIMLLGHKDLTKYIDADYSTANIIVRHNVTSSWELSALLKQVDGYVAEHFPKDLQVRYSGEGILINNAADYMAVNSATGFSTTFIVIGLIHAFLFMSIGAGFLSMVPSLVPILFNYGMMGLFGIPLNTGTCMIASITLGVTVDNTIHHMIRYSDELKAHHDQKAAMFATLRSVGKPITYISLALAGGFFIMVFSNFVPTRQFGMLSALVMLVALVTELFITPILMGSVRLLTIWDMVLLKMDPERLRQATIFQNFSKWEIRKITLLGVLQELGTEEFIIHQGDIDAAMYMVLVGRLRVSIRENGHERILKKLSPGDIFGEMSVVEETTKRTADVIADEPAEVLRIDRAALDRLRRRFPYTGAKLFLNLARILSERLKDMTQSTAARPR